MGVSDSDWVSFEVLNVFESHKVHRPNLHIMELDLFYIKGLASKKCHYWTSKNIVVVDLEVLD